MSEKEPPWVAKLLADRLIDIKPLGKVTQAIPKDAPFDILLIRQQREILLEPGWEFIAVVNLLEKVSEEHYKLCRLMKRMECELSWKGVLRRKPEFIELSGLTSLRKHIPELVFDERLVSILRRNDELSDLLQSLKPERMLIFFSLFPPVTLRLPEDFKLKLMVESYESPRALTAFVVLNKLIWRGMSAKRQINEVYKILSLASMTVRELFTTLSQNG